MIHYIKSHKLFSSAALFIYLIAPSLAAAEEESPTSTPTPADATQQSGLQDIVVIAQKRSQNLQKVPIAVTVVSAGTLDSAGVLDTRDLATVTPGLSLGHTSTAQLTYLRGVGQSSATPGGESPIATYLDGIYLGSPSLSLLDLGNVDQIAILRGPQGTLFGRNATGGLFQVTTKRPSFTTTGNVELGYGNFNTISGKGYISGPLSSNLAASFSASGRKSFDGYMYNTTTKHWLNPDSTYALQGKLLWTPDARTEIVANGFYTRLEGADGNVFAVYPGTLAADGLTVGNANRTTASRYDSNAIARTAIGSLKIQHDFDWARLSNQTSYVDFKGFSALDSAGIPGKPNPNNAAETLANINSTIQTFTNETQLQSPEGQDFTWLVGLFYLHEKTNLNLTVYLDDVLANKINSTIRTSSYSAFAQATKSLVPGTRLTLGLRYSKDIKDFDALTRTGLTPVLAGINPHATYPKLTWRIALDQDLGRNVLAYVSYDRGFKSGNFNNTSLANPPYKPEVIDAYQAGLKTEFLDRTVRLNVAGFYYNYKGIQLKSYKDRVSVFVFNAANSEIYGVDADLQASLTPELSLTAGVELLHAKYTSLANGSAALPNPVRVIPANCTGGATNTKVGGATAFNCNLSGNDMARSPNFSGNIGIQYSKRTSWGRVTLNVADAYTSKFYFEPDDILTQPSFHMVTASASWRSVNDRYSVRVWGTNLANENIFQEARANGGGYTYVPAKPRTYGLTFGVSF